MAKVLLVLLLPILLWTLTSTAKSKNREIGKWACVSSSKCVLSPTLNISETRFESQQDCRLSCGIYGAIWPMPTEYCTLSNGRVHFNPWDVHFNEVLMEEEAVEFLEQINRIFVHNIFKECQQNCTVADGNKIWIKTTVTSSSMVLDWTTNEYYELLVRTTATKTFIDIRAETVYGVRHALETLSNLVTGSTRYGLLMVETATIADSPAFPHRGLLLDTSRNYIPIRVIQRTLDAMAASKLNVFHWHIVDTHSFPMEVTRVPEMQRYGAYSAEQVYSRADQEHIIKYARLRGIRVLIEIDGPSHAGNGWQWAPLSGLGNMAVCFNCVHPPCGQLNPVNENMYATMKEIYTDVAEISAPEETIHMGADEVDIFCWNNTLEITSAMQESGLDLSLESFHKLWSEFHKRNLESWDEVNRQLHPQNINRKPVIVWSSHLTDPAFIEQYLPQERFVIQTWVNAEDLLNNDLLEKHYRIILSTLNAWYLDHGFWGQTAYNNWRTVYNNPMPNNKQVLGGETCMWSEYVDGNSVEARIWPRAGAAAERLWTNPESDASIVQDRFNRYRQRLIVRGIQPAAIMPEWCVINEGQCFEH